MFAALHIVTHYVANVAALHIVTHYVRNVRIMLNVHI